MWYADIMKTQGVKDLDDYLFTLLREKDTETVIELLPMIPPEAGSKAIKVYRELADPDKPALNSALAQAAAQLPPEVSEEFLLRLMEENQSLEVRAHAVTGLYTSDEKTYFNTIISWLDSDDPAENKAGVIAAGGSGNKDYIPRLKQMLSQEKGKALERHVLVALHQLGCQELREELLGRLGSDPDSVPLEVLEDFPVDDDESVRAFIRLLGHPSGPLNELARDRLSEAADSKIHILIESLAIPNRKIREGLYSLLEDLRISDREIVEFARLNLKKAYGHLMEAFNLEEIETSPERDLLIDHLRQKEANRLQTILRVLATQDGSGHMRIILRGLDSADTRMRSNAIEALETMVGSNLARAMIPLLENVGLEESVNLGSKLFELPKKFANHKALWRYFLARSDWVTVVLSLSLLIQGKEPSPDDELLIPLTKSENSYVRSLAESLISGQKATPERETAEMQQQTSLSEKILLLRGMEIFKDLPVGALAAIASLTEEEVFTASAKIIQEGDMGETLYLIVSGNVSVHKNADDGCELQIDTMSKGDYFGEMALFENQPRSATCKAEGETRLLVLHKLEFAEAVQEYPQIALQICQELSRRIRHLHQKIQSFPICDLEDAKPLS